MSQHDMVIANQTFPNFRADLNLAILAIISQSSGATEPTTTYAYMFWYDSTLDLLKQRNADDDAWITIGSYDQTADTFTAYSGGVAISLGPNDAQVPQGNDMYQQDQVVLASRTFG